MQAPSTLNTLLAIGTTTPTASGPTAGQLFDEDGKVFQQFLSMLGDFGAQTQTQGQGQGAQPNLLGQLLPAQSPSALAAQGLDIAADVAPIDPNQMIDVADAASLLARLSHFMQRDSRGGHDNRGAPMKALEGVKGQLEAIVATQAPKTIGQIMDAVPEAREPRLAGLLNGLMQVVRKAVAKDHAKDEETSAQAVASVQQPPANWFHTGDRAAKASSAATEKSQEKELSVTELSPNTSSATITVVEPLAQVSQVQAIATAPMAATLTTIEKQPPATPVNIDQLVSALVPVDSRTPPQKATLPEVDLPVVPGFGQSEAASAQLASKSEELLVNTKPTRETKDLGSVLSLLDAATSLDTVSHVVPHTNHGPAHAAKSLDLVATPGYINQATVKEQVHVALTQATKEGVDKITIQLEPADLGRIEVNMHTSRDGLTQIRFLVDKPETFDSLSRDARYLERSLQEAGIKADTGSMQFNLRQQPQPQMQSGLGGQGQHNTNHTPEQNQETQAANSLTEISGVPALEAWTRHYLVNVRDGVDISA